MGPVGHRWGEGGEQGGSVEGLLEVGGVGMPESALEDSVPLAVTAATMGFAQGGRKFYCVKPHM